jgi:TolB protein
LLLHGQEFHTSFWGHMGLLGLKSHFLIPDYAAYPGTAFASADPDNSTIAEMAHAQGAAVGYVHPFEIEDVPDPKRPRRLGHALPIDAALGNVDYLEVLGFSDHHTTAGVWYRLLNLGYRIAAAGGTDAMSNYASLHGPVGLNRVFVAAGERFDADSWNAALRQGKTFATNAPLLGFSLEGRAIGDDIKLPAGQHQLKFSAWMRSIVPLDRAEIVCNGKPVAELKLSADRKRMDATGTLTISASGWCLLRAHGSGPVYPIFDNYPYATTSAIYLTIGNSPPHSAEDAAYFVWWIDQVLAAVSEHKDWNNDAERDAVMQRLRKARAIYAAKQRE